MTHKFIPLKGQKAMGSKRKRVARGLLLVYFFSLLLLWFKASDIAGTRDIIAYSREGGGLEHKPKAVLYD